VDDCDLPSDALVVGCPYCGELVEMVVDSGGGPVQEYVEDCEVCCRPWSVRVSLGPDGGAHVTLTTLEGE
jgi:hypothetical protein